MTNEDFVLWLESEINKLEIAKGNIKMRQKLINLIDKYEKKLALPVDDSTKRYYSGKIDGFKVSLTLLEANGGDI